MTPEQRIEMLELLGKVSTLKNQRKLVDIEVERLRERAEKAEAEVERLRTRADEAESGLSLERQEVERITDDNREWETELAVSEGHEIESGKEVERLRAVIEARESLISERTKEVEQLRAALEPFAFYEIHVLDNIMWPANHILLTDYQSRHRYAIRGEHFSDARKALERKP
jgi:multidrug resistance efflux pump